MLQLLYNYSLGVEIHTREILLHIFDSFDALTNYSSRNFEICMFYQQKRNVCFLTLVNIMSVLFYHYTFDV